MPLTAEAATDGDIPVAVKALVQSLRKNISAAPVSGAVRSTLPGPKSASMAALKAYSEGEQLARENKQQEALARSKRLPRKIPNSRWRSRSWPRRTVCWVTATRPNRSHARQLH